ncbi:aminoacyl-tRNA hydrolase [Aliibacillus thermotolerans]|uniref:Peptidyl-tRNA hydrolase n=1 Tax=Aliibacillus thermotolerans TaxID=1834418 RepID=A0ABW0U8I1_9BACI|nr:aminoacyl-tRNA hydrolase [Aliibacillus thermotolerans]MDA3128856.1 aminoacyl-tRNA hydrolase [Aliibacillus thermotolerans]
MKVIAGLGNPGKKYERTRHNIGFEVVDQLCHQLGLSWKKEKWGMVASTGVGEEKVFLLKPLTFMNLSGEAIRPFLSYYHISHEDLLVIYDDLDLEPGTLRLRLKGGHGGHNGLRSIIDHLGTKDFKRIRIGIGRPKNGNSVIQHVLGTFSRQEQTVMQDVIERSARAAEEWLSVSFDEVMNKYN